jgi:hypothetical protein
MDLLLWLIRLGWQRRDGSQLTTAGTTQIARNRPSPGFWMFSILHDPRPMDLAQDVALLQDFIDTVTYRSKATGTWEMHAETQKISEEKQKGDGKMGGDGDKAAERKS